MALHRDIYWVGRQWAATGAGIQAVDQRLRGALDIDLARLWDDDLVQNRRAKPGVNVEDFDKALEAARTHFPRAPVHAMTDLPPAPPAATAPPSARPPVPLAFVLRAEGKLARFLPQWRVRR